MMKADDKEVTMELAIDIKIVLIGNSGVGKTSLINQYIRNTFDDDSATTVGAMFLSKQVERNGKHYNLQVYTSL